MARSSLETPIEMVWRWTVRLFCALVLIFLITPILAIIPLSFNDSTFLTYPMRGFSLRWYREFFGGERCLSPLMNSLFVAVITTGLATTLGILASLGLMRLKAPLRSIVVGLLIAPMIIPVIITAVGIYFLFAPLGLTNSFVGLVLGHTVIAVPFVVITVTATLQSFDVTLARAAASLGAPPFTAFRRVVLPVILPGVISGAVFAFATSLDEIVVSLFVAGPQQRTLPMQMLSGVREEISPAITAAATVLVVLSAVMLGVVEMLRKRSARLAGRG
jgi:putative spermidine/putrescine transport system permease protein